MALMSPPLWLWPRLCFLAPVSLAVPRLRRDVWRCEIRCPCKCQGCWPCFCSIGLADEGLGPWQPLARDRPTCGESGLQPLPSCPAVPESPWMLTHTVHDGTSFSTSGELTTSCFFTTPRECTGGHSNQPCQAEL